jgi:hypothetical protein
MIQWHILIPAGNSNFEAGTWGAGIPAHAPGVKFKIRIGNRRDPGGATKDESLQK